MMKSRLLPLTLLTLAVVIALLLAGCGLGPDESNSQRPRVFPPADTITSSFKNERVGYAMFTPDSKGFIVVSYQDVSGRTLSTLYSSATLTAIRKFDSYPLLIRKFSSAALSNNGRKLTVAGAFAGAYFGAPAYAGFTEFDVTTGEVIRDALNFGVTSLPASLIFAPGDSILVGEAQGRLTAYGPGVTHGSGRTMANTRLFEGDSYGALPYLEFSPSGRYILSYPPKLWDFTTYSLVEDFDETKEWPMTSIAYRGSDDLFVSGDRDGVYLLSRSADKPSNHIEGDYVRSESGSRYIDVTGVAASRDGTLIAAVDNLGRMKVMEAASGKPIVVGRGLHDIKQVFFSADSRMVLTLSQEFDGARAMEVWKLP